MSHSKSRGNRINRPPSVVFKSRSSARLMGWPSGDGMGVCVGCLLSGRRRGGSRNGKHTTPAHSCDTGDPRAQGGLHREPDADSCRAGPATSPRRGRPAEEGLPRCRRKTAPHTCARVRGPCRPAPAVSPFGRAARASAPPRPGTPSRASRCPPGWWGARRRRAPRACRR